MAVRVAIFSDSHSPSLRSVSVVSARYQRRLKPPHTLGTVESVKL
ncbi:MAG: hypothetical protein LBS49_10650 [Candidatus Accumulibacter sp.]|nr:hypothetical protein [Accumulibacter sp.]